VIDPNELLGQDLGGYRVTAFLGAGASAWVYRAESTIDPGIVRALKVIHPSLTQEAEFQQRFAEEAHTLDRLRHPGIVRFYGVRSVPFRGEALLVMELELLDGHTLRQYATRTDPAAIPLRRAVRWVREAAEAIGVAHQLGVVHRDLKPDNLQLLSSGQVKVLDFGLARAVDDTARLRAITLMGTVPGTPAYMAPELCRGQLPTGASDVYGLGIILFELITGRHPFAEADGSLPEGTHMALAQLDRPVPPATNLRPDVPPALSAILASVLAKRPSDRPSDAAQLAGALRGIEPMLTAQASTSLRLTDLAASQPPPIAYPASPAPVYSAVGFNPQPPAQQPFPPSAPQGFNAPHPSAQPGYTGFQMPLIPTSALRPMPQYGQPPQRTKYGWIYAVGALGIALVVAGLFSPWGPWEIDLSGFTPAHTRDAATACVRQCPENACNISDGCDGGCTCGSGLICNGNHCACIPQCPSGRCGMADHCGGSCGCPPGEQCNAGFCQCAPQCAATAHPCGPDRCGRECGSCNPGWQCQTGDCALTPGRQWRVKIVRASIALPIRGETFVRVSGSAGGGTECTHIGGASPRWDWEAGTFSPGQLSQTGVNIELLDDGGYMGATYSLCVASVRPSPSQFWDHGAEIEAQCPSGTTIHYTLTPAP
jgi:serine/threonine protein kinase